MIFAVATDERSLFAFQNEAEAIANCEVLDVEAADWLFWDDRGNPLEPDFVVPNKRGMFSATNGVYKLVPGSVDHHAHLREALSEIVTFEISAPLNTMQAIHDYLSRAP